MATSEVHKFEVPAVSIAFLTESFAFLFILLILFILFCSFVLFIAFCVKNYDTNRQQPFAVKNANN